MRLVRFTFYFNRATMTVGQSHHDEMPSGLPAPPADR